ncbi:serine phosphatase RsbU, regulator of sigma subunit [Halomicronema hongdechloris C2206]|uniref:Serine phosphatase RsbU, regulator of sigma subunit n=1 Tax=Halomicronema hongdechloris C2206 TaxID=1641165 RepID=A0A1Z3HQL9_9CYAN|nr:SpoIIE family protein phosphatase [Halomicronema hongdechloris]ASC72546.1 serine phosphatase RsbU, regulator of sigma subunit [Halomicronema hongdechloris C2206]
MPRILIIDGDSVTQQLISHVLRNLDYEVSVATTGHDGVTQAQQLQPALIVCNWRLPGEIDGITVCRVIKEDPLLSTTFLLMLTGRDSITDRIKGLEMGADDLLTKPVDINELKARVRAGLRLHHLTRDLQQQKQQLEAELAEAETYVRSLLPPDQTTKLPIQARFLPSRQLGGDCYDYYWLDPDYLVVYLLDVSGHGLGSALLSTSVLNVLRSQSLPDVNFYRPEKVLQALNETFQMSDQNEKYFTIWYGVYNQANRQLLYASAGHPPAILISITEKGPQIDQLRTPGLPIGMLPDTSYQWKRCVIPPHSALYLFSDGIYETAEDTQATGLSTFIDLLATTPRHQNIDDIITAVRQQKDRAPLADDLSLLMLNLD